MCATCGALHESVSFTSVYSNGHALHNGFIELHVTVYVFSDLWQILVQREVWHFHYTRVILML